eukprot:49172_1
MDDVQRNADPQNSETFHSDVENVNFDLKMRVYFLEEKLRSNISPNVYEVVQENIDLKTDLEGSKSVLDKREILLVKARNAIENLQTDLEISRAQSHDDRRNEVESLRLSDTINDQNRKLSDENERNAILCKKLSSYEDKNIQRLQEIEDLERKLAEVRSDFSDKEKQLSNQWEYAAAKEKEWDDVVKKRVNEATNGTRTETEYDELFNEMKDKVKEIDNSKSKILALKEDLEESKSERGEMLGKLNSSQEHSQQLIQELSVVRTDNGKLKSEMCALKEKFGEDKWDVRESEHHEFLNSLKSSHQKEIEVMRRVFEENEKRLKVSLLEDFDSKLSSVRATAAESAELVVSRAVANERTRQAEQSAAAEARHSEWTEKCGALREELCVKEEELAELKSSHDRTMLENESHMETISVLRNQIHKEENMETQRLSNSAELESLKKIREIEVEQQNIGKEKLEKRVEDTQEEIKVAKQILSVKSSKLGLCCDMFQTICDTLGDMQLSVNGANSECTVPTSPTARSPARLGDGGSWQMYLTSDEQPESGRRALDRLAAWIGARLDAVRGVRGAFQATVRRVEDRWKLELDGLQQLLSKREGEIEKIVNSFTLIMNASRQSNEEYQGLQYPTSPVAALHNLSFRSPAKINALSHAPLHSPHSPSRTHLHAQSSPLNALVGRTRRKPRPLF